MIKQRTLEANVPPRLLRSPFQLYIICSILLFSLPMFIPDYRENVKLYILPYAVPVSKRVRVGLEIIARFGRPDGILWVAIQ